VSITLGFAGPGLPLLADLYVGVLLPDGQTIVFLTDTGGTAVGLRSDLASFQAIAAGASLATPADVTMPSFSYQWTGTESRGTYNVFLAAVRAGALVGGVVTGDEILGLAVAPFSFR
jgi:hypothetical protein